MFATSPDGIHWEKHPELTIYAPEGYERDFLRDPHVCYMEDLQKWVMVVPARRDQGPAVRRGVMTWWTSEDLENWNFEGELWAPEMYHLLQMPDLFKIGPWWYMFFSEYDDQRRTRYRMSKSIHGPWIAPADDCFDGRCFYAARTIAAEGKRYLFGWNPTREGDSDLGMWIWGGTAVMQEIYQRADGTLGVRLPERFDRLFLENGNALPEQVSLFREDGCAERVIRSSNDSFCRVDMTARFTPGTFGFGIKFYENSQQDLGYCYHFIPGENRFEFDKKPNYPWFRCMNRGLTRPIALLPGKEYAISLIIDDDICILYVDGVALNARMCEKPGQELKLYVQGGGLEVTQLHYFNRLDK